MIRNYFRSAFRNMMRSKLYTAINIFCLTVGISGAILISLYLNHEFSYDRHHKNHEDIYFIHGNYVIGGNSNELALTPFPLGPALKQEFSDIKEYVRFFHLEEAMVKIDEKEFMEQKVFYTDSTVMDVFTHEFVYGHSRGVLALPNTAVVTRSLSEKYFGDQNPVDQVIEVNGAKYKVTAMIEDLPLNTHLRFTMLLSIHSAGNEFAYSVDPNLFWNINQNFTYVHMHPQADINKILGSMDDFNEKYISPVGGMIGATAQFSATALKETHFTRINMALETGSRTTLLIFTMVALFLIVIAAVNYTNLSTARASKRAREIAMRKVSGAGRSQLIGQFLGESVIVAMISLLISLLVVEIFLPGFNTLAGKDFTLGDLLKGNMLLQVFLITVVTGLIAGVYPAIFLSNLQPVAILKSNVLSKGGSGMLRKALVVFQFTISVILIAGTLTVQYQLNFLQNKNLGFNKNNRVVVTLTGRESREKIESLENTIRENPMVLRTAKTTMVPGRGANVNAVKVQSGDDMRDATITSTFIDPVFLDVMNIKLQEGRAFQADMRSDANTSILINQAAVRTYGWHDNPIGKTIHWQLNEQGEPRFVLKVVGVIEDFHFNSLQNPIDPLMMLLPEQPVVFRAIVVEYLPGNDLQVKEFLETTVKGFDPARLPNVNFLDSGFVDQFASEEKMGKIFGVFSIVCIIISFLGLFGLASFATGQRKKEIGVRKVLGSSAGSILMMFYREFALLVFLAILVAAPVTWLLMERWLEGFVYQISMDMKPIIISGLLSLVVAIVTVSYHTWLASRMNPTDAIRSE
jgi:putative ABC transport system permease protein